MKLPLLTGLAIVALSGVALSAHADEPYCREFQRKVTIGGKVQNSYGTACMQPDGDWKIVSEGSDLGEPIQVEQQYIQSPIIEPQVVYQEPLYVERQVAYGPTYGGLWGVNLSWDSHDGPRGGRWHRGWDGHGRGGWH